MRHSLFGRTFVLAALSAAALLLTPAMSAAQEGSAAVASPAAPTVEATIQAPAPRLGPIDAPAGISRAEAATTEMYLQDPGRDNRNIVWMIIGGGMLVGGAIIGDDVGTIVSVTGLVIGLVGLYRYLR
jgi:hypothetical protein